MPPRRMYSWQGLSAVFILGLLVGATVSFPRLFGDDYFFSTALTSDQRSAMYASLSNEVRALEAQGNVLKTVVKLVSPTVVHIDAQKAEGAGKGYGSTRTVEEAGSGVVIQLDSDDQYYVITNRHVVHNARLEDIKINLRDHRQIFPTKVWHDPGTDIAVLQVSATGLVPARLGDSSTVEIGDFVLAVGSPFGLSHSVTYGIISAKGRRDLELGDDGVKYQDFLQTDAAINPGNSGGPLINLRGEVIGINTAIASNSGGNEGIGFSIPINMVMSVVRQLVKNGTVVRAFLGVNLDSKFTPAAAASLGLPRRTGARVTRVTPGSPAEQARIMVDDVILEFNGVRVEDDSHLINLVSLTEVDKETPIVIFRDGRQLQLTVRVGDRQKFAQ